MQGDSHFQRRVLLVDGDSGFVEACSVELRRQGYEVLTAEDGFAALHILRGAQPDLLIMELNLPRMSGFELLSVVRTRFPAIAVIAVSSEYTAVSLPSEAICDAFLQKAANILFELVEEARRLVGESPLRASRVKSGLAPVWIPRSMSGYIILTCPECLRSFSSVEPKSAIATETCIFCRAEVRFQMSLVKVAPPQPAESLILRSRKLREKSRGIVERSHKVRRMSPQ